MLLCAFFLGCGGGGSHAAPSATAQPTATATPRPTATVGCPGHVELHVDGPRVDLDLGYTGVTYDTRFHDGIVLTLAAACANTDQAGCGTCTLTGPATTSGERATRRCADDMRRVCATDADCATGKCSDLLGPPLGLIGGGSASCVRNELVRVGSGTFDPATGALTLPLTLRWTFIEGIDVGVACPQCTGATLGDSGICRGGPHDGEACLVDATDDLLGNTSYDCSPGLAAQIGDLNFSLELTTGTSRLQPSEPCLSAPSASCYCAGQVQPDTCLGGRCDGDPGADAVCVDGPLDGLCNHDTFRGCFDDRDCPTAGDYCRLRRRACPAAANGASGNIGALERDGSVDPDHPTLVSTFCVPATNNSSAEEGLGLPGPAALRLPVTVIRRE